MSLPSEIFSSEMGDETPRRIKLTYEWKRGMAALWEARNPVLRDGEPGIEKDTGFFKVGDGSTPWVDLPYYLTEEEIMVRVYDYIMNLPGGGQGVTFNDLLEHIDNEEPHPNYDDGSSLILRYENAKV